MYMGVGGRRAAIPLPPLPEVETQVEFDAEAAGEIGQDLVGLWHQVCRAQHAFSVALRRFDLVNAYSADGSLTTTAWLRSHCHMTHAQASQQVTVARQLEELPEMASAYQAGEISYQHTSVIASCSRKLGVEVVAPREGVLVEAARQLDPYKLGLVCQHIEHMVDQDGSLDFFERQHERRRLELNRTADGMWVLRGLFDGEGGAMIATGLEKLMGPPAPDDHRPGWQRRADAMVEAFQNGPPNAQLTVIAELGTLRGLRGSPGGEMRDGLMLPAASVQRIACDCEFQEGRILDDGIHVELSGLTRAIPPKLRRALEIRDRHCRFPGCDLPPSRCDAHHLEEVAKGGETVISKLALICRRHHRFTHERGYTMAWGEGGELMALPP